MISSHFQRIPFDASALCSDRIPNFDHASRENPTHHLVLHVTANARLQAPRPATSTSPLFEAPSQLDDDDDANCAHTQNPPDRRPSHRSLPHPPWPASSMSVRIPPLPASQLSAPAMMTTTDNSPNRHGLGPGDCPASQYVPPPTERRTAPEYDGRPTPDSIGTLAEGMD